MGAAEQLSSVLRNKVRKENQIQAHLIEKQRIRPAQTRCRHKFAVTHSTLWDCKRTAVSTSGRDRTPPYRPDPSNSIWQRTKLKLPSSGEAWSVSSLPKLVPFLKLWCVSDTLRCRCCPPPTSPPSSLSHEGSTTPVLTYPSFSECKATASLTHVMMRQDALPPTSFTAGEWEVGVCSKEKQPNGLSTLGKGQHYANKQQKYAIDLLFFSIHKATQIKSLVLFLSHHGQKLVRWII